MDKGDGESWKENRNGAVRKRPKSLTSPNVCRRPAACKRAHAGGEKGGDKLSNGRREFNSNVQFKISQRLEPSSCVGCMRPMALSLSSCRSSFEYGKKGRDRKKTAVLFYQYRRQEASLISVRIVGKIQTLLKLRFFFSSFENVQHKKRI